MFEFFCENLEASFGMFCGLLFAAIFVLQLIDRRLSRNAQQEHEKTIDIAATIEQQLRDECTRLEKQNVDAKANLEKQKARVQPLQDKHDKHLAIIADIEKQLESSQKNLESKDLSVWELATRLSAQSEELDRTTAELSVMSKSRDAAVAEAKQLVAKLDSIVEVIDPSGTLADEMNGGCDGLEE